MIISKSTQLTDVTLEGSSRTTEFASALTKNVLKFGLQDGEVTEVCGQIEEPTWVINFKKGLLSTFQNSMKEDKTIQVRIIIFSF